MPSLDMVGPFEFKPEVIRTFVTSDNPGNYALGYLNDKNMFIVKYVGRSDDEPVRERILQHLMDKNASEYSHFKFSYETNTTKRFIKECKNYHDFGENEKLNNDIHPDSPNGLNLVCPYCIAKNQNK